jgi:hypothetical protein
VPDYTQPQPGGHERVQTRPCKYCGRLIVWIKNDATGNAVPLDAGDARSAVYRITRGLTGELMASAVPDVHINHWITCPNAEQARKDQQAKKAGHGARR